MHCKVTMKPDQLAAIKCSYPMRTKFLNGLRAALFQKEKRPISDFDMVFADDELKSKVALEILMDHGTPDLPLPK